MRLVITEQEKKDILSSYILIENVKQAKKYVELGLLSNDILEKLISIDPSKTNKYVGWMSKIWMNEHPDLDQLRNTIEEYNVFLNKGKVKTKDINQFKTFKDLQSEVDILNQSGEGISNKDLESDYDTIVNNEDLLIMSPHTHEASRKLGLSHFSFRDCGNGEKDSAWCTTYKSPDHFNSYYYNNNVTFYYIKVKSEQIIENLKKYFPDRWKNLIVVALVVLDNDSDYDMGDGQMIDDYDDDERVFENIDGYDGLDNQINGNDIKTLTSIMGLNDSILVPRRSTEERSKNHQIIDQKKIQQYIKNGSQKFDGDLNLNHLTTIPQGFSPIVGGSLMLDNLTTIPQGFNPTVGENLNLKNLTTIPQGFSPTVGRDLYLLKITTIPNGFNPTVGGNLWIYGIKSMSSEELKKLLPNVKGNINTY